MKTLILILIAHVASASAWNVCNWPPYFWFTFVGQYPVAQQYCSSNFPVPARTVTSTAAPSTTIVTASPAASTTVVAPAPTTTLAAQTTTVTTTSTTSVTTTSTVSVYTTVSNPRARRDLEERAVLEERGKCDKNDKYCNGWASCLSRDKAFVKTLCSCIQTPKTSTVTSTPISTSIFTPTSTFTSTPPPVTSTPPVATVTETDTETDTYTVTTTTTVTSVCPAATPNACNGQCTNFQTDKFNCNGCGNGCVTGFICRNGGCVQPNPCNYQGQISYCYSPGVCTCYQTTEGRGFCADSSSSCGPACSNSDNCAGNTVCVTVASIGCGLTSGGSCSLQSDIDTCANAPSKRMFVPRGGSRNGPADDGHSQTLNARLEGFKAVRNKVKA